MTNKKSFIIFASIFCSFCFIFSGSIDVSAAVDPSQVYVSTVGNDSYNGLAATYDGVNGPKKTINNATSVVTTDGTINILAGTYNETGISVFRNMNFLGAGQTNTILNNNHTGRYFTVGMGVGVSFTNLTLTNGGTTGTAGGAIFNMGSIILTNCDVTNNVGGASGGAIYSVGTGSNPTSVTASDCNFINNSVTTQAGWGGVIINALGTVNIKNSNFINNHANQGGIIYNNYGTGNIQFCRIIGNTPATSQIYADANSFFNATTNWWGSNAGPGSSVSSNVDVSNWLILTVTGNPDSVVGGGQSQLIADFQHDNFNNYYDPTIYGHVPNGLLVTFAGDALGTVNPSTGLTDNGQATTTFTAGIQSGISHPTAALDLATVPGAITIAAPPVITKWDPASNAVNVPSNKLVTVTYSQNIQSGTMFIELKNKAGTLIPITVSIVGNKLLIDPVNNLAENKYTIYLHTGCVTGLTGSKVASANSKFSVGTSPTVTKWDPASGATNIARNKQITITFSENITKGTNFIELKNSSGTVIPITITYGTNKVTLKPNSNLAANTKYTIYLHTGCVTDIAGNPLAPTSSKFTTGA